MASKAYLLAACVIAAFAAPTTAETIHIEMQNLGYTPATVSAHVGDTSNGQTRISLHIRQPPAAKNGM
jgi:plastocyanin